MYMKTFRRKTKNRQRTRRVKTKGGAAMLKTVLSRGQTAFSLDAKYLKRLSQDGRLFDGWLQKKSSGKGTWEDRYIELFPDKLIFSKSVSNGTDAKGGILLYAPPDKDGTPMGGPTLDLTEKRGEIHTVLTITKPGIGEGVMSLKHQSGAGDMGPWKVAIEQAVAKAEAAANKEANKEPEQVNPGIEQQLTDKNMTKFKEGLDAVKDAAAEEAKNLEADKELAESESAAALEAAAPPAEGAAAASESAAEEDAAKALSKVSLERKLTGEGGNRKRSRRKRSRRKRSRRKRTKRAKRSKRSKQSRRKRSKRSKQSRSKRR